MGTRDLGQTWSHPEALTQLGWRPAENDLTVGVCDITLGWHAPTGKVLGIGHTARYTKRGFAGFAEGWEEPRDLAAVLCVALAEDPLFSDLFR